MIFGLDKKSHNQTLNIKTDFENNIICDVRITLMTSCVGDFFEKLRNDALGAFTFLSIICVLFNRFSRNSRTMYLDDCAIIPSTK